MLMYGNMRAIDIALTPDCRVVNFSSLYEGINQVGLLPPNWQGVEMEEFDTNYWNWILGNDDIFLIFMNNIAHPLYLGQDVFLIMGEFTEGFNESLLKLIQIRYGIYANKIDTMEDLFISKDKSISPEGYINYDYDINRMVLIYETRKMNNAMVNDKELYNEVIRNSSRYSLME